MAQPTIIFGNSHQDERGIVRFVNDFSMDKVVRMYSIEPQVGTIRAWQGHKSEIKWFFVSKGAFLVKTVNMKTFERNEYQLHESTPKVLEIPGGYYNGFEALDSGSVLMVFSNFELEASQKDDFRMDLKRMEW